tara:strand:- start:8834 stop:9382 length:549 start_codon:yes stop_codon:yes gene_type:complete
MAILLSGAVLASSVLPPAVCHAHSNGEPSHSHGEDHKHSDPLERGHVHRHETPTDSGHTDHDHSQAANGLLESVRKIKPPVAHLHFAIAGFDFSLPLPSDDGVTGPLTPECYDAGFFGIVRLTDDTITVSQVDLSAVVDVSIAIAVTLGVSVGAARWNHVRTADRSFLCDSARCERSGVLLI